MSVQVFVCVAGLLQQSRVRSSHQSLSNGISEANKSVIKSQDLHPN